MHLCPKVLLLLILFLIYGSWQGCHRMRNIWVLRCHCQSPSSQISIRSLAQNTCQAIPSASGLLDPCQSELRWGSPSWRIPARWRKYALAGRQYVGRPAGSQKKPVKCTSGLQIYSFPKRARDCGSCMDFWCRPPGSPLDLCQGSRPQQLRHTHPSILRTSCFSWELQGI